MEIHQNVRGVLYCAALRKPTVAEYDAIWLRLVSSTNAALRTTLFTALGCTQEKDLLKRYLSSALPSTNVENVQYGPGDHLRVFNAVYQGSQFGVREGIAFLAAHVHEANTIFGPLNDVITDIASCVVDEEGRTDVS